jgi:signal peptidase II
MELLRLAVLCTVAAFNADWATKWWALNALEGSLPLGSLLLGVVHNDAFAFSAGAGEVSRLLVLAVRLVVVGGLAVVAIRLGMEQRRHAIGLGLVCGGGLGNAADIAFREHGVVDFIGAGPFSLGLAAPGAGFHLVFNIADLAVLIGIGLLAPLIRDWALRAQARFAHWERRWLADES